MKTGKAFQDFYPDHLAHCYGCGRLNEHGLRLRSFWDGEDSIASFTPRPEHIAVPGYVYGGLIASLIDCHGTGTAAAAAYRHQNRSMAGEPAHYDHSPFFYSDLFDLGYERQGRPAQAQAHMPS